MSSDSLNKFNLIEGESIFFVCDILKKAQLFSGIVRNKLAQDLNLIDKNQFLFCWIIDFPMFELDEKTNKIQFSP